MAKRKRDALRTTGRYTLSDLKDAGVVRFDLWSLEDPTKSYEATACEVLPGRRRLNLVFGQVPPWSSKPVTAISVEVSTDDFEKQLDGFADIRSRLDKQGFKDAELKEAYLKLNDLEPTAKNYVHESAQVIRAICGDDSAMLDFYKRPLFTDGVIEARPDKILEYAPVLRVCCPPVVLASMLLLLDEKLEVRSDA